MRFILRTGIMMSCLVAMLGMSEAAFAQCTVDETEPVTMVIQAEQIEPGQIQQDRTRGMDECVWWTRQRVQVPEDCNVRGVTIHGDGPRPDTVDIERLVDDTTANQRSTTSANGNWSLSYNGSMLCSSAGCLASRYRVTTNEEMSATACFSQTVTITLRLFD